MSLELIASLAAVGTFVVIAASAVAALIQLRHLRTSNQLNGLLTMMQMWETLHIQGHYRYVFKELPEKLKDPAFLTEAKTAPLSRDDHPELLVADYWEQVGTYMKYGLIDERSWLDIAGSQARLAWNALEPVIIAARTRAGPAAFENFEYIAVRARLWEQRYPDGNWPRNQPRMADLKRASQD